MKQRYLLSLLLLTPFLAHADPLNNGSLALGALMELVAFSFAGLTVLLVVLAFLRPASRVLQIAQVTFLGLFVTASLIVYGSIDVLVGVTWGSIIAAVVPLALLLNGLAWARRARWPQPGRFWASLVIVGSFNLLWQLAHLNYAWQPIADSYPVRYWVGIGGYLALILLVSLFAWGLALALLRWQQPAATWLWQSWWHTPTIVTGLGSVYALLYSLRQLYIGSPDISAVLPLWHPATGTIAGNLEGLPLLQLPNVLLSAVPGWAAGVTLLYLFRPAATTDVTTLAE